MNPMLLQAIGGMLGAAGSLMLLFVLPTGLSLAQGKTSLTLGFGWIIGAVMVLVATLSLGALSAVIAGTTDFKTAVIAGLAYQSTIAGGTMGATGGLSLRKGKR